MGRPRKHNKHLPARWVIHHGAVYYMVPPGQEDKWDGKKFFRLGATESQAYRTWAERVDPERGNVRTVGQLLDRYMAEHVPTLRPATQRDYTNRVAPLRVYFGDMLVDSVEPHHVHDYMAIRAKASPRGAVLDKKVLQHCYGMARKWGVTKLANPCAGIRTALAKSDRYVEDGELATFYKSANPMLKAFINFAMLTGQRKKDILEMRWDAVTPDGIKCMDSKTGKRRVIAMTDDAQVVLAQVRALRSRVGSVYLFANRDGQCYVKPDATTSGFDSQWTRAKTKSGVNFSPHDLRAKVASDTDAGHAQKLLGHTNQATTAGYRRKPEVVLPHHRSK